MVTSFAFNGQRPNRRMEPTRRPILTARRSFVVVSLSGVADVEYTSSFDKRGSYYVAHDGSVVALRDCVCAHSDDSDIVLVSPSSRRRGCVGHNFFARSA